MSLLLLCVMFFFHSVRCVGVFRLNSRRVAQQPDGDEQRFATVFLWIGVDAAPELIMASQLQIKTGRTKGQVVSIEREGEESDLFWEAFEDGL